MRSQLERPRWNHAIGDSTVTKVKYTFTYFLFSTFAFFCCCSNFGHANILLDDPRLNINAKNQHEDPMLHVAIDFGAPLLLIKKMLGKAQLNLLDGLQNSFVHQCIYHKVSDIHYNTARCRG